LLAALLGRAGLPSAEPLRSRCGSRGRTRFRDYLLRIELNGQAVLDDNSTIHHDQLRSVAVPRYQEAHHWIMNAHLARTVDAPARYVGSPANLQHAQLGPSEAFR